MPPDAVNRIVRRRLDLRGRVQGVGFRPCVYRLAVERGLTGHVSNSLRGATLEIEGDPAQVEEFQTTLTAALPPEARVSAIRVREIAPLGAREFHIAPSAPASGDLTGEISPDLAICAECAREIADPLARRYRYPFTNCTHCGPRFSIIRGLPYDRPLTTMAAFEMCPDCRREYEDPADRRFHAQPIACPRCGPKCLLEVADGRAPAGDAIAAAADLLRRGAIVAIKGIGGYHLACRADDDRVVRRLRARKGREAKPLAVMVENIDAAARLARLSSAHARALRSIAAPIVLAPRRRSAEIAPSVAPHCAELGLLLPYTPLHLLLMGEDLPPLVMTSANFSGEPLLFRDDEAQIRLAGVADAILSHNRDIVRPVDDSVVMIFRDAAIPLRRARGYAPEPLALPIPDDAPCVLAVGGEMKNAFCLLGSGDAILSPHIGEMDVPATLRRFHITVTDMQDLLRRTPTTVAHDLHPAYASTRFARRSGVRCFGVQHHHAHLASLIAEHASDHPLIGLVCDGTGLGIDGAVWGCELLWSDGPSFRRLAHLDYFPLPGGDAAARETWRPAAGLLWRFLGDGWLDIIGTRLPALLRRFTETMLQTSDGQAIAIVPWAPFDQAPRCSSLGRLFDAAAFILGIADVNRCEAQAAIALQAAAAEFHGQPRAVRLHIRLEEDGWIIDPAPLLRALLDGLVESIPVPQLAFEFHAAIADALAAAAHRAARESGCTTVGLTGGCFANSLLLERTVAGLEARGLAPLVHRHVPPGDGGLALGQACVALGQTAAPGQVAVTAQQNSDTPAQLEASSCA